MCVRHVGAPLDVMAWQVYEPSDDTFLLMDAIEADAALLAELRPTFAVELG